MFGVVIMLEHCPVAQFPKRGDHALLQNFTVHVGIVHIKPGHLPQAIQPLLAFLAKQTSIGLKTQLVVNMDLKYLYSLTTYISRPVILVFFQC